MRVPLKRLSIIYLQPLNLYDYKKAFIAALFQLLRMDIKGTFRGIYANHAARISQFAK